MPRKRKNNLVRFSIDDSSKNANELPYSLTQQANILAALNTSDDFEQWLPEINQAAMTFLQASKSHSSRKLTSEVRREAAAAVETIDNAMKLFGCLNIERAEIGLSNFNAANINFTLTQLGALRSDFEAVNNAWKGRGKPRTTAPRELFVHNLLKIWIDAGNPEPSKSTVDGVSNEPFSTFVKKCMSPLAATQGLTDVIRTCLGIPYRK